MRPRTVEEVSRIMKIAFEHSIFVTPRGASSGRSGGSIPLHGGITLTLDRMTDILELDKKNMMVTCEAGVRTMDLYDHCAKQGLFYPPDPASWKYSLIGGNVAENAGGMRAVKYGVTSNYVMGLEVVMADGAIIHTGGKSLKNVTGYNLTQLIVGSEGTLGIVTKAILRLIPMPAKRGVMQVFFRSLDDGCTAVHDMLQQNIVPSTAELIDDVSLEAIARQKKTPFDPEAKACLILEIDGPDDASLKKQSDAIGKVVADNHAVSFRVAQSQAETDELWAIRRGLSSAVAAMAPNRLGEDISVPRNSFPEAVRRLKEISSRNGLPIAVFGHAGDGNLHPSVLCDLSNPAEEKLAHQVVGEIFDAALAVGGTLSGEHGIGITKKPYIVKALGEAGVAALKAVKQALDPKGILNPGKIW
ncbi:MAG TPA: FAD-linked oxidase C-terminal domain-containing protein [Negativicutes bacterium]|nr:FAD-linked oxidase C-terminal domain-containing protein [Negativicutes bacterium]